MSGGMGRTIGTRPDGSEPSSWVAMSSALVVIDMLNTYDFEDADRLVENAAGAVPNIRTLLDRARDEDVPIIYVNDNYGDWNSSADELVQRGLEGEHPELVEPIRPPGDASFVIKARHSIFFSTPLEYLLAQQGIDRLVMVGQVTEQCILYSALDAYVRHVKVAVPTDAVAHIHPDLADAAVRMMELNMDADITPSADCLLRSE
jgi:nicotinamidase-related amidase